MGQSDIDMDDVRKASDADLLRMLNFALKNDPSGPRMRETPPKTRAQIIEQLCWLGIIQEKSAGWGTGYY